MLFSLHHIVGWRCRFRSSVCPSASALPPSSFCEHFPDEAAASIIFGQQQQSNSAAIGHGAKVVPDANMVWWNNPELEYFHTFLAIHFLNLWGFNHFGHFPAIWLHPSKANIHLNFNKLFNFSTFFH
jgi:hypothetical protein